MSSKNNFFFFIQFIEFYVWRYMRAFIIVIVIDIECVCVMMGLLDSCVVMSLDVEIKNTYMYID